MKKVLFASLMLTLPAVSMAASYGPAGCGVGSILFDGQSGKVPNILAATTNGIFANQTFGMTFGTLGCDGEGTVKSNAALYIDGNMENIAADMARGQGEALDALAEVMGILPEDRASFSQLLHENFASIYQDENVRSSDVIASMVQLMSNDDTLRKYVS